MTVTLYLARIHAGAVVVDAVEATVRKATYYAPSRPYAIFDCLQSIPIDRAQDIGVRTSRAEALACLLSAVEQRAQRVQAELALVRAAAVAVEEEPGDGRED